MHMLKKQDEIDELDDEEMDHTKFWGMLAKDEDEDFDISTSRSMTEM